MQQENWTKYTPDPDKPKESVLVRFYDAPKHGGVKNNRDVWLEDELVLYVDIKALGSKDVFSDCLLREEKKRHYAQEYPEAYAVYMGESEGGIEGTPLNVLPGLDSRTIAEWSFQGVYTVEQLADASDHVLSQLGPGARTFQKAAKKEVELNNSRAMADQLAAMKAEIERLKNGANANSTDAGHSGPDRGTATKSGGGGQRSRSAKGSGKRKPGRPRAAKNELGDSPEGSDDHGDFGDISVQLTD